MTDTNKENAERDTDVERATDDTEELEVDRDDSSLASRGDRSSSEAERKPINAYFDNREDEEQNRQILVSQKISQFTGSISPPTVFKEYDEILPGAADRMLTMNLSH